LAIRYEIELPLRSPDGVQIPPLLLRHTVNELDDEFGTVQSFSIYRPGMAQSNPDEHAEWIRFWFEARDVSATHDWIARWLNSTARPRFGDVDILVAWYHPVT
jgi:hypothetical protein